MVRERERHCKDQIEARARLPVVLLLTVVFSLALCLGLAAASAVAVEPMSEPERDDQRKAGEAVPGLEPVIHAPLDPPRESRDPGNDPGVQPMVAPSKVERDRDGERVHMTTTQTGREVSVCASKDHGLEFGCSLLQRGAHDSSSGNGASADTKAAGGVARAEVAPGGPWSELAVWGAGVSLLALLALVGVRLAGGWMFLRALLPAGWRLDQARVRSHPTRRVILSHLEKHPGATAQELAEAAGVRNRHAVYHLSILRREDFVNVHSVEGRKHYFMRMAPKADLERLRLRPLLRATRPTGRVLACLARGPGSTVSQVARVMGFSPGHAHYHLSKLEKEGLVERVRRGRRVRHYLTESGHEVVALQVQVEPGVAPGLSGSQNGKGADPAATSA